MTVCTSGPFAYFGLILRRASGSVYTVGRLAQNHPTQLASVACLATDVRLAGPTT
jgi:hypothetical protein